MSETPQEFILAEEQSVLYKPTHLGLSKEVEGTLVLTNRRLIFVAGNKDVGIASATSQTITFAEVDDIDDISKNDKNLFMSVLDLESASGHKGLLGQPSLKINWKDENGASRSTEFHQEVTGRERKRNLSDWALVIEKVKTGSVTFREETTVEENTLEGRVFKVMSDLQTKGTLQIEEEVESKYNLEVEPDEIEDACSNLATRGLLLKVDDPSGDLFYRKRTALPSELDLSY